MKVSVGIVCSVLGATIAFYLAIISPVTLPSEGTARWFAIGGISTPSLIAGILINGISMQDYFKVSRAYDSLTSRLSPLLFSGIEDVLQRRKDTFKSDGDLKFMVSAPINGFNRVVGATYPAEDPVRKIETKFGVGIRGFFAERKVAGYARPSGFSQDGVEGSRPLFDRAGRQLGEVPLRTAATRWNMPVEVKWLYFRPIFEKSTATPWSNHVVGIFSVHSSADDADSLFKTAEFQHQVDSIASEVSPYLDAIQVLTGEEKL